MGDAAAAAVVELMLIRSLPPKGPLASYGILNQADCFVVASNVHGFDVKVAAFQQSQVGV